MKTNPSQKNRETAETGEASETAKREKRKGRERFWALIIIIILLLLLFLIFQWKMNEIKNRQESEHRKLQFELAVENARKLADSIIKAESLKKRNDSLNKLSEDTLGEASPSLQPSVSATSSPRGAAPKTPSEAIGENLQTQEPSTASTDTIAPIPSILPPSGRYYKPINLRVECNEPKCQTEISIGDSLNPQQSKIENYNKTGNVYFRAIDSVGNASSWELASYDMASDNSCSENSYPVPVNGKTVCVDAYEFPNKAGEKPRNMVSQSTASQLCENDGKRLCSIEEWQAACKGNSNSRYPYGNSYNQTKCVTDLKSAKEPNRSGFAEHCRSWHGMYDMSGNLWEWTSTPAQREGLFLVAGGAWNTQNASSCTETKFSFYPQNEYPFVGFRCCK